MIKVHIRNFQSIEDLTLEIDGLTVITGTNNTGKSTVIRAIRGVFQNTRGINFIRRGKPKCTVTITFDDGQTVTWEKGRGKADKPTYIINGGPPIYPGQGVPDEVKALGVRSFSAGGRDIWPQLAAQFQQVFLLDQPGSVMAEAVADVDRVSHLNDALRQASSDRRAAGNALQVRRVDEQRFKEALTKFDGLDQVAAAVEVAEKSGVVVHRVEEALEGLNRLKTRRERAVGKVQRFSGVSEVAFPEKQSLLSVADGIDDLSRLRDLRGRRQTLLNRITRLDGVAEVETDFNLSEADKLAKALDVLYTLRDRRKKTVKSVSEAEDGLKMANTAFEQARAELVVQLDGLDQCPVCGRTAGGGH